MVSSMYRTVVPNLGDMEYFLGGHGTVWKLSSNYTSFCLCVLLHIFFFYEWEHRIVPVLSLVCIPQEMEKKGSEKIKRVYKIFKKCNKKPCHPVPKVVIDLPFEGRKYA